MLPLNYKFKDRREAGIKLGDKLLVRGFSNPVILALPRGGVPVAAEVAHILGAPLDVVVARKIGAPGHEEFGIGALSEDEVPHFDPRMANYFDITGAEIKSILKSEKEELKRRVSHYRAGRELPDMKGRTVILIDDGLATGNTAAAAGAFLKTFEPGELIFAAPVCPGDISQEVRDQYDEIICLHQPRNFQAVGLWYENFPQVKDEEVMTILSKHHLNADIPRTNLNEIIDIAKAFDDITDFSELIDKIKDKRVVMLGESSHGTQEFYEWRRLLSKELLKEHGFNFIAVEGDWPACERLNQYIHRDSSQSVAQVVEGFSRWPTWMWGNTEVVNLMNDLREINQSADKKVSFYGLDVYSLYESLEEAVKKLIKIDPTLAAYAKKLYACFDPYKHDERSYAHSLYRMPKGCQEEVVSALSQILQKNLKNDDESFDVIQNARIIRNAEKYYRAMVTFNDDSWNVRDRHMMETLDNLLDHHGPNSKAIIWAHNTHIGDYKATNMANHGQINLGGLAREKYGKTNVSLVGFTTYSGRVTASDAWDGPIQILEVPEAIQGSLEDYLHEATAKMGSDKFYVDFSLIQENSKFLEVMGNRAIGVVYHPSHEHLGNYVPTIPAKRYDAMVFFNQTRALTTIDVKFRTNNTPETYPFGDSV